MERTRHRRALQLLATSSARLVVAAVVAMSLVVVVAPSAQAAANVVPNGDFEQGGCGDTPIICGWTSDNAAMARAGSPDNHSMYLDCGVFGCYGGGFGGGVSIRAQTDPAFCATIGSGPHPASFSGGGYFSAYFYQGPDCTGFLGFDSLGEGDGVLAAPPGTQSALFEVGAFAPCEDYCSLSASFDDLVVEDTVLPIPMISSFSPAGGVGGANVEGPRVELHRDDFSDFNGTAADFTVDSNSLLHATVPDGATTGPISVTTPDGTSTSRSSFTIASSPEPAISSFTPMGGHIGTSVDILGWSFTGATRVAFDGKPAVFSVDSDSQIHTTVPSAATSGPISVTSPSGTATSCCFQVPRPPSMSSFSPTSGAAGTIVTIQGESLGGATSVTFNGTAATFTWGSWSITATVPEGATTGPIAVTTPAGTDSIPDYTPLSFTVTGVAPSINSSTPTSGPVGTRVDIDGAGLTGATSVAFNGTAASYTGDSDTHIHATVPNGATTGPIAVTTPEGTATSTSSFTVTAAPPSISSFTPTNGPVGTLLDIQGTGFTGTTSVDFNGTAASYTVDSDTHVHATVPNGATTGPIAVTTPRGAGRSSSAFTFIPPPTIVDFSPTRGAPGASVRIEGEHLGGNTRVAFNGRAAAFTVESSFLITATVPSGATTGPIAVTTPGGTATSSSAFSIIPPPTIAGFSPTSGRTGEPVMINGLNLNGVTALKLGTRSAQFSVNSSTMITAIVPTIARGYYKWSVTTAAGTATSSGSYRVR